MIDITDQDLILELRRRLGLADEPGHSIDGLYDDYSYLGGETTAIYAYAEAERRWPSRSGDTFPIPGYVADARESAREHFIEGVVWAAGRPEVSTTTVENAARVLREQYDEWLFRMHGIQSSCDHSTEAKHTAQALAEAGLLATARTLPTREQIARALAVTEVHHPDQCDCGDFEAAQWCDGLEAQIDSLLALLRGGEDRG